MSSPDTTDKPESPERDDNEANSLSSRGYPSNYRESQQVAAQALRVEIPWTPLVQQDCSPFNQDSPAQSGTSQPQGGKVIENTSISKLRDNLKADVSKSPKENLKGQPEDTETFGLDKEPKTSQMVDSKKAKVTKRIRFGAANIEVSPSASMGEHEDSGSIASTSGSPKHLVSGMNSNSVSEAGSDSGSNGGTIYVAQPKAQSKTGGAKRGRKAAVPKPNLPKPAATRAKRGDKSTNPTRKKPLASKKQLPQSETPSPSSPQVTETVKEEPNAIDSITANGSQSVPFTFKARRAEHENSTKSNDSSFWAAETTAIFHSMQDSCVFVAKGMESLVKATTEAVQTEDIDQAEQLLAGIIQRAEQISRDYRTFVTTTGKAMLKRATDGEMVQAEGFKKSMTQYRMPDIVGAECIKGTLKTPSLRQPNVTLFETTTNTAPQLKRKRNQVLEEALARLHKGSATIDSANISPAGVDCPFFDHASLDY